jgi:hypothetical protein
MYEECLYDDTHVGGESQAAMNIYDRNVVESEDEVEQRYVAATNGFSESTAALNLRRTGNTGANAKGALTLTSVVAAGARTDLSKDYETIETQSPMFIPSSVDGAPEHIGGLGTVQEENAGDVGMNKIKKELPLTSVQAQSIPSSPDERARIGSEACNSHADDLAQPSDGNRKRPTNKSRLSQNLGEDDEKSVDFIMNAETERSENTTSAVAPPYLQQLQSVSDATGVAAAKKVLHSTRSDVEAGSSRRTSISPKKCLARNTQLLGMTTNKIRNGEVGRSAFSAEDIFLPTGHRTKKRKQKK